MVFLVQGTDRENIEKKKKKEKKRKEKKIDRRKTFTNMKRKKNEEYR